MHLPESEARRIDPFKKGAPPFDRLFQLVNGIIRVLRNTKGGWVSDDDAPKFVFVGCTGHFGFADVRGVR